MTTEERIVRLERQNRRMKGALSVLCVVVTSAFLIGAGPKNDKLRVDTLTAKNIFVTNGQGKMVVGLGVDDTGNGLVLTMNGKGP